MKNNRRLDYIISENLDRVVRHKMVNEQRFAAIFRNNLMNESAKLQKFVAKKSRSLQEGKGTPVNMDTQLAHMFEQATRKTLMECNARHIVLSEEDMRRVVREVIQEWGLGDINLGDVAKGVGAGLKTAAKNLVKGTVGNGFSSAKAGYNAATQNGKKGIGDVTMGDLARGGLAAGTRAVKNVGNMMINPFLAATEAGRATGQSAKNRLGGKQSGNSWMRDASGRIQNRINDIENNARGVGNTPSQSIASPTGGRPQARRQRVARKPQTAPSQPVATPPSREQLSPITAGQMQNMARRNRESEIDNLRNVGDAAKWRQYQQQQAQEREAAQARQADYNDALTQYNTQKADRQLVGSRAGRQYRNNWAVQEAERQGRGGDKQYIRQLSRQMKRDARAQRRGEFDNY